MPYRSARPQAIVSQVKSGQLEPAEALAQLKGIRANGAEPKAALKKAEGFLKAPDQVPTTNIAALQSASKNIGDMIARKGPNGMAENEAIVRELTTIKKSLDHQIAAAEPAHGQAQKTFAEMSKPIDRMKVGQTIFEKATSALRKSNGEEVINAESFAKALRGDEATVKAATGFKRNKGLEDVLTPQHMSKLRAVETDLARYVQSQSAGKVQGSATAQHFAAQHMVSSILDPLGLPRSWKAWLADDLLAKPAQFIGKKTGVEEKIHERITDLLLNPDKAAAAAKAYAARQQGATASLKELAARSVAPISLGVTDTVSQRTAAQPQ